MKRMLQKPNILDTICFATGVLGVSFGIALFVQGGFGTSVASSVPYVLSLRFTSLSLGVWSYIVQGLSMLLLVMILRQFHLCYLLSFITSIVSGYIIDAAGWALGLLPAGGIAARLVFFTTGFGIFNIGVALMLTTALPIMPFDLFLRELAQHKGFTVKKLKTGMDAVCFASSLAMSLIFFHGIKGIGLGTLVCVCLNGTVIGYFHARITALKQKFLGKE